MKFDCGETYYEKRDRLSRPHRWFAWYPVRVKDHDCRWLEYVERTGERYSCRSGQSWWVWSYKELE